MITRHTRTLGDTWTDLVATAASINPTGPDAAAGVDATYGFLTFANGANASAFVTFQLPHSYAEGTDIEPHIHWQRATSSTEAVKWRMKTLWYNVGSTMPDFSAYSTAREEITAALETGKPRFQHIDAWTLDGAGKTISSLVTIAFQRNDGAGGGDAFAGVAEVVSVDVHYQQRQPGSVQEYRVP